MKTLVLTMKLVLAMTFVLVGCSKKTETSNITIALPNFKTLGGNQSSQSPTAQALQTVTSRIMINISGSGMTPVSFIWSLKSQPRKENGEFQDPPLNVTLPITRGPDRIIQVLAITEIIDTAVDSGDDKATFYYGDTKKTFSEAESSVVLSLSRLGTATSDEGGLSGRYFNADGSTPTGKIDMYFAPAGKPEMLVDREQTMFSGFFQIFLPADLDFTYKLADSGTVLFNKINVNSSFSSGSALAKFKIPAAYRSRSGGLRYSTPAQTKIAGFFGPGNESRSICYSTAVSTIQNLYISSSVGNSTEVSWNPSSLNPAVARVEAGGVGTVSGHCPIENEFGLDHFTVATSNLANGDSPVGIDGPFRRMTENFGRHLTAVHNGSAIRLNWRYLKPTLGNSVGGVGIFHKTFASQNAASAARWHDSIPCSQLTSSTYGFKEETRVPFGSSSSPVETYDLAGISQAIFNSGTHMTVVCPYSVSGQYYDFGLVYQSGSSGYAAPATQITATVLGSNHFSSTIAPTKIAQDACTPMLVRTVDAGGAPAYRQTSGGEDVKVHLSIPIGHQTQMFMNNLCSGTGDEELTLSLFGTDRIVYLLGNSSASSIQISMTDATVAGTPLPPVEIYLSAIPKVAPTLLRSIVATTAISAHQCYPVDFVRGHIDVAQFVPQSGTSANPTFAANVATYPGLGFFTSGDCTGTSPSGAYFSGTTVSSVPLYFKYTGAAATISIAPDGGTYSVDPTALSVVQPGPVTQTMVMIPMNVPFSQCTSFRIQLQDSQGRPSVISSTSYVGALSFATATPANSGIYSDPSCTSMPAGGYFSIPAMQSQSDSLYLRWSASGPISLIVTTSAPAGIPATTVPLFIAP